MTALRRSIPDRVTSRAVKSADRLTTKTRIHASLHEKSPAFGRAFVCRSWFLRRRFVFLAIDLVKTAPNEVRKVRTLPRSAAQLNSPAASCRQRRKREGPSRLSLPRGCVPLCSSGIRPDTANPSDPPDTLAPPGDSEFSEMESRPREDSLPALCRRTDS